MKQKKIILIAFLAMLLGTSIQAQNGGLEGTYLNVGSGNTLVGNGGGLWGNAMGENNYVESANALTVGNNDTIGQFSVDAVALGGMNRVNGTASMAFGNTIKIHGNFSLGAGRYLKTTGNYNMVLGCGLYGTGNAPDKFLENNYGSCLFVGFNSTKPTLTVGPSPNDYPQGNNYDKTGKVAIGDVPVNEIGAKLHVRSDVSEDAGLFLEPAAPSTSVAYLQMRDNTHLIQVDSMGCMTMRSKNGTSLAPLLLEGRVGINALNENEDYALAVNGGILTDEIMIREVENWYDHVLGEGYKLLPLKELQDFIAKNGHLPEVLSEKEVREKGYNIAEMQGVLLKKIEELTLYTLEQQKCIDRLEQKIQELEKK